MNLKTLKMVTLMFAALTLSACNLTVENSGGGKVTSNDELIDCGEICVASYDEATEITLSAEAEPGYVFDGWSGRCEGQVECVVTVGKTSGNKTVTANFTSELFALWKYTGEVDVFGSGLYIFIDSSNMTYYTYEDDFNCYSVPFSTDAIDFDDEILTIVGPSGNLMDTPYVISDDILTIELSSLLPPLTFEKAQVGIDGLQPSCLDSTATGSVSADITFAQLDDAISLNNVNVSNHVLEYQLELLFDVNMSGEADAGDLELAIMESKFPGADPVTKSLSTLNASLWVRGSNTLRVIQSVTLTVENNTMRFTIPKSAHIALRSITQGLPVSIKAYYKNGAHGVQEDRYPNSGGFTSGLDTTSLMDASGDVSGDTPSDETTVDITQISVVVLD